MTSNAAEKLIEALTMLLEGYRELQESLEEDLGVESEELEDESSSEASAEVEGALVTEMRSVIEMVMEGEDFASEEVATLISTMTDALEEIDPDVFEADESEEDEDEEVEEDIEIYEDDEDLDDLDEDDLGDDDDDDYEEEDEEEDDD